MIAAYLPKEACNINNIQYPIIYNNLHQPLPWRESC